MPNPRAVLYLRLSESDDASTSIARQEADLRLRAEREGWEVVAVIVDDGLSGGKHRPNADRALAMLANGEADVLAVWKFDRWSRQGLRAVSDLIEVLDAVPGTLFVADRDGLASSQPAWRIIASVLAEVARMERENTKERVTSSVAALRKARRYSGGNLPYGYRPADNPNGPGRVLVVDPDEAAVVGEAARRVLAGQSVYSVTLDLNARGIPTRRGTTWSIQALRQVLTSDPILGRVRHKGDLLRDDQGMPVQVWPPVLNVDTWHRVRAAIGHVERTTDERGKRVKTVQKGEARQRERRSRLLSGLVRCVSCDAPLYVRNNGKGSVNYSCSSRSNGRTCDGVSISADLLDEYVSAAFLAEVGDREVMERVEEGPDFAALAEVQRAIRATTAAMADDDADDSALAARLSSLKARRADLRNAPRRPVVRVVGTGETFAAAWERGDLAARQAILAANVAALVIRKGLPGRRGLDVSRVVLVMHPAHSTDAAPAETFTPGRVVA